MIFVKLIIKHIKTNHNDVTHRAPPLWPFSKAQNFWMQIGFVSLDVVQSAHIALCSKASFIFIVGSSYLDYFCSTRSLCFRNRCNIDCKQRGSPRDLFTPIFSIIFQTTHLIFQLPYWVSPASWSYNRCCLW